MEPRFARIIQPNEFSFKNHYYERVRNAHIHPLVKYFMSLPNDRIIDRYCHLHPEVDRSTLEDLLNYDPTFFSWSGADLFPVTTEKGSRKMVLIETNSCPSGQKSMPLFDETEERGGYKRLLEESFIPKLKSLELPDGVLAVMYDKNKMEASGYAATLADLTQENVYLVEFYNDDKNPPVKFEEGIMYVRDKDKSWHSVRAAFKYVTQKPWNRIPVSTKTYIFNPMVVCLAGGRNKLVAAKAYSFLNGDLKGTGLEIRTPETILDLSKFEIKFWIQKLGGFGVIKVPYSNAGQGIYTITSPNELDNFLSSEYDYDIFIVQSLIGNSKWSSIGKYGRLYHIGTVPDKRHNFYVADLRMMVISTEKGYRPIAIYARRANSPLTNKITNETNSSDMLVTNLSFKNPDGSWGSDTNRLLLMDDKDFNQLGIGLDDLIEGYIQTVLASIAIDKMAKMLYTDTGVDQNLFRSLDHDESLMKEIKNI